MKSILDLLNELRSSDIKIWSENGKLRYNAPKGKISDELLTEMRERKEEILTFLEKVQSAPLPKESVPSIPSVAQLLGNLEKQKVKFWIEKGQIRYAGSKKVLTPQILSQLQQYQGEILQLLQAKTSKTPVNQEPIVARNNSTLAPLSFTQERFWFLWHLDPKSPLYHVPLSLKLTGNLNLDALRKTLNTIVQRHEVLRTNFRLEQDLPVQIIQERWQLEIPLIDLANIPEEEQQSKLQERLNQLSRESFDLSRDLMLRATLLKLRETEYALVLVIHHIATDGWSMGILFREITALYNAFVTGNPNPLPQLPLSYADFATWQKNWLQGKELEKQLAYWQKQLDDYPTFLELPIDRPRPATQTFAGAKYIFTIDPALNEGIKEICRQEKITPFMLFLGCLQTLLSRYTGQEDLVVGTPIANRNRIETEGIIGAFVNTLLLRTRFTGNPTVKELLQQVRNTTLGAYEHQDVPLEKLIQQLQPERYKSGSPLLQVMFAFQNTPKESLQLPNLVISRLEIENPTAKFDLTLFMSEREGQLRGCFEYNTDLFEQSTIARMAIHFQNLLQEITVNPERRISELPLLTSQEKQQLLLDWNHTSTNYPKNYPIHELFEKQAVETPDNIAVVFEGQTLTYRQLNEKANQLAHYLDELGVTTEILVGIYVERSLHTIIGILGILKAGGAYVPLATNYPQERLAFMVEDTQLQIILTQDKLKAQLPPTQAQLVCLDKDWENIAQESPDNLIPSVSADNLAYIMYTSGSTGTPKGVNVLHRGVVRLVKGCDYADFNSATVFLQLAPIAFDASTLEIWAPLLNGGKIVLCQQEKPSLKELGKAIEQYQISSMWLTASLFNLMVDERLEDLKGLNQLLIGGDVLSVTHVQKFLQQHKDCRLINGYGPTENTTFSCCYTIPQEIATRDISSIPIGKAIANTQVYILDQNLQPVPIGVKGELYVGGDGLARGYLNRPELTAEKFIDNPFGLGKLYKTGDFARYLSDGNIEFLGRIDNQLKIRGFRIESGEVEALLNQHPAVRETVVIGKEDNLGNKQLVAYLTYQQQSKPTPEDLRIYLREKLPDYMIPDFFVLVESFPLTPNGKIDRKALPNSTPATGSQTQTDSASDSTFVAPRTHLELQLTKIWEQVLGVKPIGIRDNFFNLGGHSLLALTLFEKIEQICKATIPMATLFAAPTIEELAKIIRQKGWVNSWMSLVPIKPQGTKPPLFYLHGVLGTVMSSRRLAEKLDQDQPLYGIQAQGLQERKVIHNRLEEMAADYIRELQTLQPEGPYNLIGVCTGGLIALEMAQQLRAQNQTVAFLGLLDTQLFLKKPRTPEEEASNDFLKPFIGQLPDDPKVIKFFERHFRIVRNYHPKRYAGKITYFLPTQLKKPRDTAWNILNWCSLAEGGLEVHRVPGDHLSMIRDENVPMLGEKVQECLNQIY